MKKRSIWIFVILAVSCSQSTYHLISSPFSVNENQIHFVIIQLSDIDTTASSRKQLLINFQVLQTELDQLHQQSVKGWDLKQHPIHLIRADRITPLLVVRKFENLDSARSYLQDFPGLATLSSAIVDVYPISLHNYRQCLVLKETTSYLDFRQTYLEAH